MKEGALADKVRQWKKDISKQFDPLPDYLIPALQYVQRKAGFLPCEAMTALAQHLRVPEAKVFGVASFYSLFRLEPRGRNQITVCRGTACHVRGSAKLLGELENMLGISAGGTTADRLFTLETAGCLGACALATHVVVNDRAYGRQTAASVKRLVKSLSTSARGPRLAKAVSRPVRRRFTTGRRGNRTRRAV